MLLGAMAAKFAKFLDGLVEDVPLVKDISALLKDAKKTVGDFSLKEGKPPPSEAPKDVGVPRDMVPDPDTTAKPGDFTPEQLDAANKQLADHINDRTKVREVTDPQLKDKYDLEVDLENGQKYRRKKDGTWAPFRESRQNAASKRMPLSTKLLTGKRRSLTRTNQRRLENQVPRTNQTQRNRWRSLSSSGRRKHPIRQSRH